MINDEQPQKVDDQLFAPGQQSIADTPSVTQSDPLTAKLLATLGLADTMIPDHAPVEVLALFLEQGTLEERTAAARKLGESGQQEAVIPLIAALKQSGDPRVRAAAGYAIGKLAAYAPAEPLLDALMDNDAYVRAAAIWVLGQLRERLPDEVILPLFAAFSDEDENTYVRVAALRALGNLGERVPLQWLVNALKDPAWQIRHIAATILGEQADRAPEEVLRNALQETQRNVSDDESDESTLVRKAIVHALGKIFQHISGWSLAPIRVDNKAAPEKRLRGRHIKSGEVEFEAIEPADLAQSDSVPIVAQALDNQWVPRTLLNALLQGKVSMSEADWYLKWLIRTEYIRSLINGEQVIINRAFLYNNPSLFQDYLPGGRYREAFKTLLSQGSIIPFLVKERQPDEEPEFDRVEGGFPAWQQICQEVYMQCMRYSWDNEEEQQDTAQKLARRLHELAKTLEDKDIRKLMTDLAVDPRREDELRARLEQVHDSAENYARAQRKVGQDPYVTRNILYKEFVTAGESPSQRLYDGSKKFAGEIKQLLDLAYNANLADVLGGHLLTPVDSLPRLLLQEWEGTDREKKQFTVPELIEMLRHNAFSLINQDLYLKSMGLLSLQDVLEIRKTDEWKLYIKSLQNLLKEPYRFHELANGVYRSYTTLARRITSLLEQSNPQQRERLIAPWDPSVSALITVGNASLSVIWNQDGAFYHIGEEKLHTKLLTAGAAPFSVRLTIGDPVSSSSRSRNQAQLFSSIDIMKGKMLAARDQWEEIMHRFKENPKFREFLSQEESVLTPTINEQARP